ncbi:MAG: acetyl/propionyl/methylcrotonyl-CoA carboxylase subunit alpha [Alphaproteobacteria bacterium]
MFRKILIANRGEIACRVMRTCRRMGIKTVAVYSEADAAALHVEMADEAIPIGPPAASESYLKIDAIVAAARASGADAVHPGYGFLSENSRFAAALAEAGITFIGPPTEAVRLMGDKIESKRLARESGVSTIPGGEEPAPNAEDAVRQARAIGYPVMLKAAAGGGGKGMRIARDDGEVRQGFRSATHEAQSSFGDARVFLEKYVEEPRHIEIQVVADTKGHAIYLGERECSIQRRHQKVIEEAPSPFLDAKTRAAMGEQAVKLAKAVGYVSAGTVEFVVDAKRNFYFLEMNTRLQVEHPVTEMVTGLDLVELMIRIAAGEPLGLTQKSIKPSGWAIEARVYAEDPVRNFLPSVGRLTRYVPPPQRDGLRVDSGVREGDQISIYYDPMIAKVIGSGTDRAAAIGTLGRALDSFVIRGIAHNVPFLSAVLRHEAFGAGRFTTDFIARTFPDGFAAVAHGARDEAQLAAIAAVVHRRTAERDNAISGRMRDRRPSHLGDWVVRVDDKDHPVRIQPVEGGYAVTVGTEAARRIESDWQPGALLFTGRVDGAPVDVQVTRLGAAYRLLHGAANCTALVLTPRAAALAALMPKKVPQDLSKQLLSPMPGLLVSIAVKQGQTVKTGEELAVIEAMKMENVLRAERDGTVAKLHAAAGDSLAVDQAILEFE